MVIDRLNTTVAYRCPHCTGAVISGVGAFSLSGDLFRLKCPCGQSEMTVTLTSDSRVRLNVPCLICPKPHNYVVSREVFFGEELFSFPCALTGIDLCFIGKSDDVVAALGEQETKIKALMRSAGIESLEAFHPDDTVTDPQINDIVRFMLNELDDEGSIHCGCTDTGDTPLYNFEVMNDGALIYCEVCGKSAVVPLCSISDAESFISTDRLDLK